MNEVSTLIANTVAALNDPDLGWPEWNTRAYDPLLVPEDSGKQVLVTIAAITLTPSVEPRGIEELDTTVMLQADIYWRFVDRTTHQVAHPLDLAATLLAWSKNRWIEGSSTVGKPVGATQVLDSTWRGDANTTLLHYVAQWTIDLVIDPRIDTKGPAPVQLGGAELTPPLRELYVNQEQKL